MIEKQQKKVVALDYDKEKDGAPRVVAKGEGMIAEKIIEKAEQNDITVHEDPALAQILYQLELNQEVPSELYPVIAEVFALVYQAEKMAKDKS